MCEYLNNLFSQDKERLSLSEDRLSYHLAVMEDLRCKSIVQKSTGIQEFIHLTSTQQYSASHTTCNICNHLFFFTDGNAFVRLPLEGSEIRYKWELPERTGSKGFCPQVSGSTHTTQCTGWQSLWQSIQGTA